MKKATYNVKRLLSFILTLVMILSMCVVASAQHNVKLYFNVGMLDVDSGEIPVDLCIKDIDASVESYKGDVCSIVADFNFDEDNFYIKKEGDEPLFITDEETLIKKRADITGAESNGKVSFSFMDNSLKDNLIEKDGVLCRFILVSRAPLALWNSFDKYPLEFVPASIGMTGYNYRRFSVHEIKNVEGINAMYGGYNRPQSTPSAPSRPKIDTKLTFKDNDKNIYINGVAKEIDATPFILNDVLMVPFRFFSENVGLTVSWDGKTDTAMAKGTGVTAQVSMKEKKIYVNAKEVEAKEPPVNAGDRIYIPIDIVSIIYTDAKLNVKSTGEAEIIIP